MNKELTQRTHKWLSNAKKMINSHIRNTHQQHGALAGARPWALEDVWLRLHQVVGQPLSEIRMHVVWVRRCTCGPSPYIRGAPSPPPSAILPPPRLGAQRAQVKHI